MTLQEIVDKITEYVEDRPEVHSDYWDHTEEKYDEDDFEPGELEKIWDDFSKFLDSLCNENQKIYLCSVDYEYRLFDELSDMMDDILKDLKEQRRYIKEYTTLLDEHDYYYYIIELEPKEDNK